MEVVTLKDIAKALNLSTSTVSRALRDSYEINEKTKILVAEYAKKVNYRPNPIALSLKDNKSRAIGVIVPEIANNFFSQAINGIEDEAYSRGYHVVICQSHESLEREKENLRHLFERRVDGILISLSGKTMDIEHILEYSESNFAVVFFDRVPDSEGFHKVVADNFLGAFAATEYLIKQGKKRIAHITSPLTLSITKERLEGYKKALEKHGIEVDNQLIKHCGFDPEEAKAAVNEIMNYQNPDAFFTCSDRLALHCYEAYQNRKNELSAETEFFGFTNLNVSHLFSPKLSTVVQPAYEMGTRAAKILLDQLESKRKVKDFEKIVLETYLKIS
ncbi:LacI family DNA-binding transcriptional regulator [Lacihabitans sp. CS3-21]|uniref:LacI family DNA-binding transcriptional regulator n=1 Tax=Lacihabitans sp. CS3-21 TaxID=2487332 RepID=UPI0020CF3700|nr:LacI family DNA-binding transcriptional regulator [Lacihabitans sp. CS3-21]MCP9749047.1 LacI family transcriptional regulator [Lacihabitans sp. CS3-21]